MVIVECIKCKNKVPKSELFITDGGKVTRICSSCVDVILHDRIKIDNKIKTGPLQPRLKECIRCGKPKLWPMEFPVDDDRCITCSKYKTNKIMNTGAKLSGIMRWREKYPEKYEEQKKRNREKRAMKKSANPEKFKEKARIAQARRRERLRYLFNAIDKVEREYERLILAKKRREMGSEQEPVCSETDKLQVELDLKVKSVKKSKARAKKNI